MSEIINTNRVILRYFRDDDLASFMEYRNDQNISKYQSWSKNFTKKMAKRFLKSQRGLSIYTENQWVQVAFEEKTTGVHIGDCAVKINDKTAELGFTIAREKQRNGFAFEALSTFINVLFVRLHIHRIYAITDIDNTASINLLKKLKFRKEGHTIESYFDDDLNEWRDEFHFGLLSSE